MERKRPRIANKVSEEKNKVEVLTLSGFMTKATERKTVWYWQKNREINNWNRKESPETDLHKCIDDL